MKPNKSTPHINLYLLINVFVSVKPTKKKLFLSMGSILSFYVCHVGWCALHGEGTTPMQIFQNKNLIYFKIQKRGWAGIQKNLNYGKNLAKTKPDCDYQKTWELTWHRHTWLDIRHRTWKNLETKYWREVIGEWRKLRGKTQVMWVKPMAGQKKLRKTWKN